MRIKSKKIVISIASVIFIISAAVLFFYNSNKDRFTASHNHGTSIASMLGVYAKDKMDIKLTIGLLKADKINYKVFGAGSKELEPAAYEYEIGSISKTFTASMLCKAMTAVMFSMHWSKRFKS